MPPVAMARTRNKIDGTRPKASGGDGDGERHSTPFNPKPNDQAHSTRKQRETRKKDRSAVVAIDGRGRKIDERKKKRVLRLRERERELRVKYREREREKIVKKLYAHAIVPVHICTGSVATCIYTQVYPN